MGFGNKENVRLGCINMGGNNTSNTHCGFAACRISPPYCQLTPPPPARPRSTSGHFNVTDRRNTPPEPQYTAVKIVSTQAQIRKDFVYILPHFCQISINTGLTISDIPSSSTRDIFILTLSMIISVLWDVFPYHPLGWTNDERMAIYCSALPWVGMYWDVQPWQPLNFPQPSRNLLDVQPKAPLLS